MNPLLAAVHYPTSSEADLDRLQALTEQLAGFDDTISLEWLDGAMTALAAGPRQRPLAEWRDRLLADTWTRTFADPHADREAMAVLQARWNVLLRQLDPEPLMDAPEDLRLAPVMIEWAEDDGDGGGDGNGDADADAAEATPAAEAEAGETASGLDVDGEASEGEVGGSGVDAGDVDEESLPRVGDTDEESLPRVGDTDEDSPPRVGEVWAIGFMEVVATFVEDWPEDPATFGDQADAFEDALARIALLGLAGGRDVDEATARLHAGSMPTRDELIEDALYAVQDLRVFFIENAAKPETRRVGPQPGRNDPCPCGSGLKFKKCHGRA